MWRPKGQILAVDPQDTSTLFLETGFLTQLQCLPTKLDLLASEAPGMCLSLLGQRWDRKYASLCTAFDVGSGNRTQVFMLA